MFFFGPESEKPAQEIREIAQRPPSSHHVPSPPPVPPSKQESNTNGGREGTPQSAPKKSRKPAGTPVDRNGASGRKAAPTSAGLVTNIELNAPNGHPPATDTRSPSVTEPALEDIAAAINGVRAEDRMDIDTDTEQQPEVLPEPPIVHTLMNGESRAIQVEPAKVADLTPSTTIVGLERTNISQVAWHPTDSTMLTARADMLCGVWRMPGLSQGINPFFQDLINYTGSDETFVTAIAWEPQGRMLAVAISSAAGGELHLYDGTELGLLETLSASQRMIMRLQWQKDGMRLVGLAPMDEENAESSILLWDLSSSSQISGPHCVTVPETLEDVDCAMFERQGVVCASGGKAVYHLRAFSELAVEQKWASNPTSGNDSWSLVKCAWQSFDESLIVAASSESGRIWLPARDLLHDAHQGPVNGLQIRPQPARGQQALSTTEFATCSVDGTIKAWYYDVTRNSLITRCKLTMGQSQPLKSLSYSPDGFCLAGASFTDVRIWNAEHGYNQMATWQGSSGEWLGHAHKDRDLASNDGMSSINGDAGTVEHSLSWDSDSMKLAFSLASQVRSFSEKTTSKTDIRQVAIINFQR